MPLHPRECQQKRSHGSHEKRKLPVGRPAGSLFKQTKLTGKDETIKELLDKKVAIPTQLAKYNYCVALAVQKDFGTDRYMNKLAAATLLEEHHKMKVSRHISWHKYLPNTIGKLEKIIYRELNEKRPVFLHFDNLKDFGHFIVVDGYCYKDGTFMIHPNQGQGGPTDGWYDFHKGILRPNDNALWVVHAFKPLWGKESNCLKIRWSCS